jgi:iduronate 2-sulfatase
MQTYVMDSSSRKPLEPRSFFILCVAALQVQQQRSAEEKLAPRLRMLMVLTMWATALTSVLGADQRCSSGLTLLNNTGLPHCTTAECMDPHGAMSAAHCCAACAADPAGACVAWTWNAVHGSAQPSCYFKHDLACDRAPSNHSTSGIIGPPPTPPPTPAPHPTPAGAKNILFIAVDDMRPNLGAYNHSLAHTPHLDALAASGLRFDRAYVQYAFCSPSRNSFMSGRRPDTTRVWEFVDHFRERGVGAGWASLPQYFKNNGYLALGAGKLYHPASATENVGMPNNDYPASWTPAFPYFDNEPPNGPHNCTNPADPGDISSKGEHTWCAADVPKEASVLSDQKIRDACIGHLRLAANVTSAGKRGGGAKAAFSNFFVGCGFHKPHVPWVVPQEFFDAPAYPRPPAAEYPLATDTYAPIGMPLAAWHPPADVGGMGETPAFNGTCNETRARLYRRAYDAAITYQDFNIGTVLAELDALGFTDTTLVIVFGDHGWQLGEHDTWAKSKPPAPSTGAFAPPAPPTSTNPTPHPTHTSLPVPACSDELRTRDAHPTHHARAVEAQGRERQHSGICRGRGLLSHACRPGRLATACIAGRSAEWHIARAGL